jgi:hypothetical protein
MKTMKQFLYGKDRAQMGMVGAAVGLLITLIIVVLIYYNISASIDTTAVDAKLPGTPAANATGNVNSQAATFFTIAPIIAIVIVAVVVIGYVQRIGSA